MALWGLENRSLGKSHTQLDIKVKASQSLDGMLLRMPHIEKSLPPTVLARLKRGSKRAMEHNPETIILVVKVLGITELTSGDSHQALNMLHQFISLCDRLVDTYRLQRVENTGACLLGLFMGLSV